MPPRAASNAASSVDQIMRDMFDRSGHGPDPQTIAAHLHTDDDKARLQVFVRCDGCNTLGQDFSWGTVLAIRLVGGQSCAHVISKPGNIGRTRLQWTDTKHLHHATTMDAWVSIAKYGVIPGHGASREARKE
eukprot:2582891-Pyramimonas_sp.AAC.1